MRFLTIIACVVLSVLFDSESHAQPAPSDIVSAEFLPGWQLEDGRHVAALRMELSRGWKTYWRVPGQAGITPRLQLDGVAPSDVQIIWPEPIVFSQSGVLGIGYQNEVVLPFVLDRPPSTLNGRLDVGVCREVCVPLSLAIDGPLSPTNEPDPQILASMVSQPISAARAGVAAPHCEIRPLEGGFAIQLTINTVQRGAPRHAVVEVIGSPLRPDPQPLLEVQGDTVVIRSEIMAPRNSAALLARDALRVTLLGNGRAVELNGCS